MGETVANVDHLFVCRAAPGERTPTLDIQSDQLFTSVHKTSHGYQYKNKIMPAQWGRRDVDLYPQAQQDGNRNREAENADQDAAARGVK